MLPVKYSVRILAAMFMLSGSGATFANNVVTAEVWADNWFELYVNGNKVLEDSVPITTERSFNAESASFELPAGAQIAIIAKDFKENDTGLEYIGSRRQQMGDGGLIAQIKDASDALLFSTDSNTRCMVLHHAPVDAACAEEDKPVAGEGYCDFTTAEAPDGWMSADFDDSDWAAAIEYSEEQVSPKMGYDEIIWDQSARLVWTESLTQDNTVLCRLAR